MSQAPCAYCAAADGGRCVSVGSGRFVTECRACGRVTEERLTEVEELFVERARESPLCIVTPDFINNDKYRAPALEDDPFERIGFITAFSTWSLELAPLLAVTSSSFSGHLAELERVLSDFLYTPGGGGPGGAAVAPTPAGVSVNMVEALRAYYQIVDVTSVLGLERDSSDHAVQLFRDCSSTTYLRNRNIEALATAALVQASREAQEPRTFQEISAAANLPQKEIGRHMKVLTDALKLSQPINSNSISVHMPRFCGILQLSKPTQDLATHIGEVVINKSFCTRRNPISISAAAIYLACQLEDKRKTQTEICKATGLTEVTLRKVYKELLENLNDLLPPDYTPAVPPEKAFPVSAAVLGRVCANRASAVAHGEPSVSNSAYVSGSNLMSNGSSLLGSSDPAHFGGSSLHLPSAGNHVRSTSLPTQANMSATGAPLIRGSNPSAQDGRTAMHLFAIPPSSAAGVMTMDSLEQTRLTEATMKDLIEREHERDRLAELDPGNMYGGLKISPVMKHNLGTPVPSGSGSSIRAPYFSFPNIDPRLLEMWSLHPPYSLSALQDGTGDRGFERSRDDAMSQIGGAMKGGPQFVNLVQGPGDPGNVAALPPSVQLKIFQLATPRGSDAAGREREQKQNAGSDIVMLENEVERKTKVARLDSDQAQFSATSSNGVSTFAAAAAVRSSFPWALPTSFGNFGNRLHSIVPQGGNQAIEHFGALHSTATRETMNSLSVPVAAAQLQERQHQLPVSSAGPESGKNSSALDVHEATCAESPSHPSHPVDPPSVDTGAHEGTNGEVPLAAPEAADEGNAVSLLEGDTVKGDDSNKLSLINPGAADENSVVVEEEVAGSGGASVAESSVASDGKLLSNGSIHEEVHDGKPLQHIVADPQAVSPATGPAVSGVLHLPGTPAEPEGNNSTCTSGDCL